jgi:hypothetical protein
MELMMSVEQLTLETQPCPFCGGTNFGITCDVEDREGTPTQITCDDCGCNGPWVYLNVENISEQPIEVVAQLTGWNMRFYKNDGLERSNRRRIDLSTKE